MLRPLLLSACLLLLQDPPPAKIQDPLAELVKKSNALEGFTAKYRMTDREGAVSHVTLFYGAPGHAAMTMVSDRGTMSMWSDEGALCMYGVSETPYFARLNQRELGAQNRVVDVDLPAEFPGAPKREPSPLPAGACFRWDWIPGKNGERPSTDIAAEFHTERTHVCGWLQSLQRRSKEPRETDDEFVWTVDETSEVHVSKLTGFITRERGTDPGSKSEILLESLDLVRPDANVFTAPESAPKGAVNGTDDGLRALRSQGFDGVRTKIWRRLGKWIDDEHVIWDERSPAKLTRVFRTLHAQRLADSMRDYLEKKREWVASSAEDLASRVSALEPGDARGLAAFKTARDRALADFKGRFTKEMATACERLHPPSTVPANARMSDKFLQCERDAIRAEYESQVIDPLVALFREKTDAALKR
jgi:hypothetical protein